MRRNDTVAEANGAGGAGVWIALASALCLVAGGLLLWWREGSNVFVNLLTTSLAWCF